MFRLRIVGVILEPILLKLQHEMVIHALASYNSRYMLPKIIQIKCKFSIET
jgi:hypothetical protein